jgi:hypothetical protein
MRISKVLEFDPESSGGSAFVEVLEGEKEFLDAITVRLDQIVARPRGRFVVSYTQGQPGARKPPSIH